MVFKIICRKTHALKVIKVFLTNLEQIMLNEIRQINLIGKIKLHLKEYTISIQEKSRTTVRNVKIRNSDVTNTIPSSTCNEKENTMEKE